MPDSDWPYLVFSSCWYNFSSNILGKSWKYSLKLNESKHFGKIINNIHRRNCFSCLAMEPIEISISIDKILSNNKINQKKDQNTWIESQQNNIYPLLGNFPFYPNYFSTWFTSFTNQERRKSKPRTTFTSEQIFRLEDIFREKVGNVFKYEFIFIFRSISSLLKDCLCHPT